MKSKTIIMSNTIDNSVRGILTIFIEDDLLKCRLRTYNLQKLSYYCKLGIYHEGEVFSANLIERNGVYESSFVGDFFMDKDFYIALIDTQDSKVLLCGGTYQGFYFNDNSVFLNSAEFCEELKENIQTNNINEKTQPKNFQINVDNLDKEYKTETNKNSIEKIEQTNKEKADECGQDCDKCAKCRYKEFFYSNQNSFDDEKLNNNENLSYNDKILNNKENLIQTTVLQTQPAEVLDKDLNNAKLTNLTSSILPQFENLFNSFNQDEELNKLIENSKFVKVEEAGEQYSIGAIYENENIKYICYAIKKDNNINPPNELGENYQWLPIDALDPLSSGYFVVFQDANDLKIVKI